MIKDIQELVDILNKYPIDWCFSCVQLPLSLSKWRRREKLLFSYAFINWVRAHPYAYTFHNLLDRISFEVKEDELRNSFGCGLPIEELKKNPQMFLFLEYILREHVNLCNDEYVFHKVNHIQYDPMGKCWDLVFTIKEGKRRDKLHDHI